MRLPIRTPRKNGIPAAAARACLCDVERLELNDQRKTAYLEIRVETRLDRQSEILPVLALDVFSVPAVHQSDRSYRNNELEKLITLRENQCPGGCNDTGSEAAGDAFDLIHRREALTCLTPV
jgi:hypothetical protein